MSLVEFLVSEIKQTGGFVDVRRQARCCIVELCKDPLDPWQFHASSVQVGVVVVGCREVGVKV